MKIVKRRAVAIAAMVVALVGLLALAPSASANSHTQYGGTGGITVSTTTPVEGGTLTVSGTSCTPGATVTISLDEQIVLATVTANSQGQYTVTVQLPAGVTGPHEIVASGGGCNAEAGINIIAPGAPAPGGGGLAGTGVAVIGIGALGLVLLVGGGLMLLAGRRRKVSA